MNLRVLFSLSALVLCITFCTKENIEEITDVPTPEPKDTNTYFVSEDLDSLLYALTFEEDNYYWFKGSDAILPSDKPASGHSLYFRVRFNKIAFDALGEDGKLSPGETFPNGSLIIKELYNDAQGNDPTYFAYMAKDPNNEFSSLGWVWSEIHQNGNRFIGADRKGDVCTGCHSENHIDYTRIFTSFP